MAASAVWSMVHTERNALASDLEGLDEPRWATPSLCSGWTVQDVLAHMTATAKMTSVAFFPRLAASGFSLSKMQEKDIVAEKGSGPADTLARFRDRVDSTSHPPGPVQSWLGETVVHSEDIRRPLGLSREYPSGAVMTVADFYKGSNLVIGAKKRVAGVTLRATDAAWTHGSGPEAAGPLLDLVLAMAGRRAALDRLSGDGVEVLRSRP